MVVQAYAVNIDGFDEICFTCVRVDKLDTPENRLIEEVNFVDALDPDDELVRCSRCGVLIEMQPA